jgi:hypothetical protein
MVNNVHRRSTFLKHMIQMQSMIQRCKHDMIHECEMQNAYVYMGSPTQAQKAKEHKTHKLPLNTCTRTKEHTKLTLDTCKRRRTKETKWLDESHTTQSLQTTYLDHSLWSIVPKNDVLLWHHRGEVAWGPPSISSHHPPESIHQKSSKSPACKIKTKSER